MCGHCGSQIWSKKKNLFRVRFLILGSVPVDFSHFEVGILEFWQQMELLHQPNSNLIIVKTNQKTSDDNWLTGF